jgi:hypothetical protein
MLVVACAAPAFAQDSSYCRRVRARAASDAALLMAPRVVLRGLRFPQTGQVDAASGALGACSTALRSRELEEAGVSFAVVLRPGGPCAPPVAAADLLGQDAGVCTPTRARGTRRLAPSGSIRQSQLDDSWLER